MTIEPLASVMSIQVQGSANLKPAAQESRQAVQEAVKAVHEPVKVDMTTNVVEQSRNKDYANNNGNGEKRPSRKNGEKQAFAKRNGSGEAVSANQNGAGQVTALKPNGAGQVTALKPNGVSQAVAPNGAGQVVAPNGAGQVATPNGAGQVAAPNGAGQAAAPNGAGQAMAPNGTNQSLKETADKADQKIHKAIEQLNKSMPHSEAVFGIHDETNRVVIKIVDKETKELIKELPPEKTLDLIAKAWELAGMLIDERR